MMHIGAHISSYKDCFNFFIIFGIALFEMVLLKFYFSFYEKRQEKGYRKLSCAW